MDIRLSWDLFVLVFFIIIVAYSFIIGKDNTLKVILGTYVSILAADAIGSLFGQYFSGSALFMKILESASVSTDSEAVVFIKVIAFVVMVIIFAVKGAFSVDTVNDKSGVVRLSLNAIYAVMSAGLVISAILVFVSGVSFIGGGSSQTTRTALWEIYSQSEIIRGMLTHAYLWFSVPAIAFLIHSLYGGGDGED